MSRSRRAPGREQEVPLREQMQTDWALVERVLACVDVRTVYLYGPPGIGKTYSAYHVGRTERGVYAITLTEDTPAAELRGHYMHIGRETVWHDGPFTAAMRAGARLVVNEISHGNEDTLTQLYPVLESIETAQLTLPNNETVRPAPGFHVVATDNAPPEELPGPLQDRFDCLLQIAEPHPAALSGLSAPLRRAALRSFSLEPERRVSIRGWLTVERLRGEFGLEHACIAVFGPQRGAQIHDAIRLAAQSLPYPEAEAESEVESAAESAAEAKRKSKPDVEPRRKQESKSKTAASSRGSRSA